MRVCLDSSFVCTIILQERRWQSALSFVERDDVEITLPGPVLTEVIEISRRKGNRTSPTELYAALIALGMRSEHPNDADLVRAAELRELSRQHPGLGYEQQSATLSLADSLVLSVAERLGCPVVTRDEYWKRFADEGHVDVRVVIPD